MNESATANFDKKYLYALNTCAYIQIIIGVLYISTPHPLTGLVNFLLFFLIRLNSSNQYKVCYLTFCFLISFLSLAATCTIVAKLTGPYGLASLKPEFYWRANSLGYGSDGFSSYRLLRDPSIHELDKGIRMPEQWQISLEFALDCLNPLSWIFGAWVSWRIYKVFRDEYVPESDPLLFGSYLTTDEININPIPETQDSSFKPFEGTGIKLNGEKTRKKSFNFLFHNNGGVAQARNI